MPLFSTRFFWRVRWPGTMLNNKVWHLYSSAEPARPEPRLTSLLAQLHKMLRRASRDHSSKADSPLDIKLAEIQLPEIQPITYEAFSLVVARGEPVLETSTNITYYSTNSRDAHIWSARARYLSSVHNGYPAVYVGRQVSSESLQCST